MPTCHRCGEDFANLYFDNGKMRDFSKRKYCVNCRPVGSTRPIRPIKKRTVFECLVCSKPLLGKQRKFCSLQCKTHAHSSYPKQKERGIVRKLELLEKGGGACAVCGYSKNITAFHFHHLDPSKKRFRLDSRAISNRTWQSILEEFAKCILLCANCHAELHNPDLVYEQLKLEFKGIEVY
jgi:hypothetical protein